MANIFLPDSEYLGDKELKIRSLENLNDELTSRPTMSSEIYYF